jgi:aryl-alcohol dehydrogenase-like predicted oxidoreductase
VLELLRDTGTAVFTTLPLVQGRAARGLPEFLREAFPELDSDAQVALQFARSTPGVTTTLVGMRTPRHVQENLDLLRVAPARPDVIERLFEHAAA